MTFLEDYNRGFEILSISAEVFARLSQHIGQPVPNEEIPTACVSWDPARKIVNFEMNPTYISNLSDEEIGAVISHETFHVLLNHLVDIKDRAKYPDLKALIQAQECIINDGLFGNVGLSLPDGVLFGEEQFQTDFSLFSTKEGYDFIVGQKPPAEDSGQEGDSGSASSSGASSDPTQSDSGSPSSENSSSAPSPDKSDDEKPEDEKGTSSTEEDKSESGDSDKSESDDGEKSDSGDAEGEGDADDDADASDDGSSGDKGDEPDSDAHTDHMCGGIRISEEDIQDFKDAVSKAINSAMNGVSPDEVPNEVADVIENLSHEDGMSVNTSGWSIGAVDKSTDFLTNSGHNLDLNWENLLARINPKIKSAGRPRQKESWHAPRRKMIGSYPEIILPTHRRKDNAENKGDSVPVVILALDMSYSIPEYLIQKLASLADSIPSDIIKPMPVTWSNSVVPFDTETRRIVKRSGTNIDNVYEYAESVEKETKTKPYVLVITDGDCKFGGHDYTLPGRMDTKKVSERWFWMATEPSKLNLIRRNFGGYSPAENIYSIADFM